MEAVQSSELLQQKISPLMQDSFSDKIANTSNPVRYFLIQIRSFMRKNNGNTKLMVFESHMQVIWPRDKQERTAVAPLSSDFVKYIQENETMHEDNTAELESNDGQYYFI